MSTPITLIVPGYPASTQTRGAAAAPAGTPADGTVKQAVTVAARRGEGGEVRVTALQVGHRQSGS